MTVSLPFHRRSVNTVSLISEQEDMIQEPSDTQEPTGIDHAIDQVFEHWQNLRETQLAEAEAAGDAAGSSSSDDDSDDDHEQEAGEMSKGEKSRKALLDSLTPEELAAAQKRALLAQYGYVEEDVYEAGDSGMGGSTLRMRAEDKEASDRRALIDKAIREEGRRKRKRKRARQQGRWACGGGSKPVVVLIGTL